MTGLHQLFPRVFEHFKDPTQSVVGIVSPEVDGKKHKGVCECACVCFYECSMCVCVLRHTVCECSVCVCVLHHTVCECSVCACVRGWAGIVYVCGGGHAFEYDTLQTSP